MNTDPVQKLLELLEEDGLWKKIPSVQRNEYLKVKGSVDQNLYLVEEGCIRAFVEDEFEEHTIRFGYSCSVIAALDSFHSGQPSPMYLQALRKTEVRKINRESLMKFVYRSGENMALYIQITELLIFQQWERELDLLTQSPKERYERVLERSPKLFQEVPAKYIASYLRMSPETLSRIQNS